MGGNRGSCIAALAAQRTIASPNGSSSSMTPMQPRKRWPARRVTNTPRRSAKTPSFGISAGICPWETASTTTFRANRSSARRSASERDGILGLLATLEHTKFSTLLDAAVELAPKAREILSGRNEGAYDHQPEQKQRQGFQGRMP